MIKLKQKIKNAKEIAIISHIRPDGDTIGGAMSMYYAVQSLGKSAYLLCEDVPPEYFAFLEGLDHYGTHCPLSSVDLCIAVDCASASRMGKFRALFEKSTESINIDHHISNERFGDIAIVEPQAAATCQILFDLYKEEGIALTKQMGKCLYTGISTDTGHFMHSNVSQKNFLQAAKLLQIGVDTASVAQSLYKEYSKRRTLLIAKAINNMQWYFEDKLCLISLSQQELSSLGCAIEQTEGIVNYALNVKGVMVGVLVTESAPSAFKVSFRSKPGFNVAECAGDFGGGGHILASGCMLFGTQEVVIQKLVESISKRL